MFEHCLYFNTTSLARQLEREWTQAFQPFGLTPPQAFMLRAVLEKAVISGTDLSQELNISKATCSRTVGGLIELGFVVKIQADEDARVYELHPTDRAKNIHKALNEASGAVTRTIKKMIGAKQFETTVKTLRSISATIG